MAWSANTFFTVVRHISRSNKLFQNGEKPRTVIIEDISLHNKHVTEATNMALKEGLSIFKIFRMLLAEDFDDLVKILNIKLICKVILLTQRCRLPTIWTNILALGCNYIVLLNIISNRFIVEMIFSLRL